MQRGIRVSYMEGLGEAPESWGLSKSQRRSRGHAMSSSTSPSPIATEKSVTICTVSRIMPLLTSQRQSRAYVSSRQKSGVSTAAMPR